MSSPFLCDVLAAIDPHNARAIVLDALTELAESSLLTDAEAARRLAFFDLYAESGRFAPACIAALALSDLPCPPITQ